MVPKFVVLIIGMIVKGLIKINLNHDTRCNKQAFPVSQKLRFNSIKNIDWQINGSPAEQKCRTEHLQNFPCQEIATIFFFSNLCISESLATDSIIVNFRYTILKECIKSTMLLWNPKKKQKHILIQVVDAEAYIRYEQKDKRTYGGVRHFILVDLIMWFRNSLSSCITVFTAT